MTPKRKATPMPGTGTKKIRTRPRTKPRGAAASMNPDRLADRLDPRSFAGSFSVPEDVRENLDIYREMTSRSRKGEYDVVPSNISSCPAGVLDSINQLRSAVWPDGDAEAPMYPVAFSVLKYGREVLAEHEVVRALKKAQQSLNRAKFDTQHQRRCVFAAAELAYDDAPATEKKKRWQVWMPRSVVDDFKALAGALAINRQASMVLALMTTLAVQQEELKDARRDYAETVAAFLARAQVRAWIIDSLVKGAGNGSRR